MQVHQAGQVYKGWRCTVPVKCEFSAARCTDAQIFLSIHQEKGNYDVEAGDPPAFRYSGSRLILVEQQHTATSNAQYGSYNKV